MVHLVALLALDSRRGPGTTGSYVCRRPDEAAMGHCRCREAKRGHPELAPEVLEAVHPALRLLEAAAAAVDLVEGPGVALQGVGRRPCVLLDLHAKVVCDPVKDGLSVIQEVLVPHHHGVGEDGGVEGVGCPEVQEGGELPGPGLREVGAGRGRQHVAGEEGAGAREVEPERHLGAPLHLVDEAAVAEVVPCAGLGQHPRDGVADREDDSGGGAPSFAPFRDKVFEHGVVRGEVLPDSGGLPFDLRVQVGPEVAGEGVGACVGHPGHDDRLRGHCCPAAVASALVMEAALEACGMRRVGKGVRGRAQVPYPRDELLLFLRRPGRDIGARPELGELLPARPPPAAADAP